MNLAEAQRQLEDLRRQADEVRLKLGVEAMRIVGRAEWPAWERRQKEQLKKITEAIADTRGHIAQLRAQKAKDRQARMMKRREAVESQADPVLSMLADVFQLLLHLRNEGAEMTPEELTMIDHVGYFLKTSLGVSSKGNP